MASVGSWTPDLINKHENAMLTIYPSATKLFKYTLRAYAKETKKRLPKTFGTMTLGTFIHRYLCMLAANREVVGQSFFQKLDYSNRRAIVRDAGNLRSLLSAIMSSGADKRPPSSSGK